MKKIIINGKEFEYRIEELPYASICYVTRFYKGTEEVLERPFAFWKPAKKKVVPRCIFTLNKNIETTFLSDKEKEDLEYILSAIQ